MAKRRSVKRVKKCDRRFYQRLEQAKMVIRSRSPEAKRRAVGLYGEAASDLKFASRRAKAGKCSIARNDLARAVRKIRTADSINERAQARTRSMKAGWRWGDDR